MGEDNAGCRGAALGGAVGGVGWFIVMVLTRLDSVEQGFAMVFFVWPFVTVMGAFLGYGIERKARPRPASYDATNPDDPDVFIEIPRTKPGKKD